MARSRRSLGESEGPDQAYGKWDWSPADRGSEDVKPPRLLGGDGLGYAVVRVGVTREMGFNVESYGVSLLTAA